MFRRRFLQFVPLAITVGLAPLKAVAKGKSEVVTYRVKGFSCVTCATGLDTMSRPADGNCIKQIDLSL